MKGRYKIMQKTNENKFLVGALAVGALAPSEACAMKELTRSVGRIATEEDKAGESTQINNQDYSGGV